MKKSLYILFIPFICLGSWLRAQQVPAYSPQADSAQHALPDSLAGDSIVQIDPKQALIDSLKAQSDLKSLVTYSASDSIIFDMDSNMLYLYGNVSIQYETTSLQAARVRIDWENETMYATGVEDEQGNLVGTPVFTEKEQTYQARELTYNFRTQKGLVKGARMNEQDGFILAEVAKRLPDGTFNAKGGRFTTCDLEDPHFYIQSKKIKVLPNDQIISGPLSMVIADFPLPIIIPFGFIPKMEQDKRRSGIVFPQYGDSPERGFFLRNLGFYTPIGENFDLLIDGDIYTRGGWRIGARSSYRKRYKYNGSFSLEYGFRKFGEKTDPDASRTTSWRVGWNHSHPIDPQTRFSASVNISSSNTIRELSFNQNDFYTNNVSSSISLQKTFANSPFSLNMTISHRQDMNKSTMNMDLPTLNLSMRRLTPFQHVSNKKSMEWLTRMGVTYNMQGAQRLQTIPDSLFIPILFRTRDSVDLYLTDTTFNRRSVSSFYDIGLRHNASASTSIKLLKYINISPSFTYAGYNYFESEKKTFNPQTNQIETRVVPGFSFLHQFSTSVSANTNFYGIYQFLGKRQFAIRQRISPSISYNLKPDFSDPKWGYYDEVQKDSLGNTLLYNRYQTGIYGSPSRGESQSIGFSLTNVFEMKYRKKESFDPDFDPKEDKFVRGRLLDNLSMSTSYNFAADSFRLAPFRFSARTQLLNNKINLNAGASMDPYSVVFDGEGGARRIDKLALARDGKLGRLTNAQVSISTSFRSEQIRSKKKSEEFDENEFQRIQNSLENYVDFDIPWSFSFSYNFSYSKFSPASDANITQTLRFNGDFNFTPKWKIAFTSGYDFRRKDISQTNVSIFRDLHCWQMSFSWVPFGQLRSYVLTISVKSPTLRDLRLNKRDQWQDRRLF
ncbi:MAG: LPS-assembly protein LptD [Bacteroidetes bacterium]|nr:MAG: LPS-assembly protein LptD [Bacteroidota bacterium]